MKSRLVALVGCAAVAATAIAVATARADGETRTVASAKAVRAQAPPADKFDAFLVAVARDVNAMWRAAFDAGNVSYRSPKLYIVHENQTISEPCDKKPVPGTLPNAFWCPVDENVYLFSKFLLETVYEKSGEFGVAYVVAHEFGHHIQGELGIWPIVRKRHIPTIQTETQADCLAGIWARSAYDRGVVEDSDIQAIIAATDLVGDARGTASRAQGAHGLAGLRAAWFLNGFRGGKLRDCKTF